MRLLSVVSFLSILVTTLPAQRVLLVDASGRTGQYKTINAAINAFQSGDIIRVVFGTYNESLTLNGKSVNIQGIGGISSTLTGGLTIQNHPPGQRSRFSRLYFAGGITTTNTSGDLLFEYCQSTAQCKLSAHTRGSISFASCSIISQLVLRAVDVEALFFHGTTLASKRYSVFLSTQCVYIERCTAEFSRCQILGAHYGMLWINLYTNGGTALEVHSSSVRISGLASDEIIGGDAHNRWNSIPGNGIRTSRSTLVISGVTVRAGLGGSVPAISSSGSTVTQTAQLRIPVIDPDREFARGVLTNIRLHALPNARSLTWLALDYKATRIPLGPIVIDLGKPILSYLRSHDTRGRASIPIDLRQLPSSFIGIQYAIQTVSLSTANVLALSAPRIGVIGL